MTGADMQQLAACSSLIPHSTRSNAERALLVAYFVLGMGLLAPVASIMQCMDYLNSQYKAHHPAKVLPTAYNAMCMAAIFTLFFLGPTFWTSKRGRMITGYLLYVAALILPSLVDVVLLDAASGQAAQAWEGRHGMALWAGGSAAAGAADAIISSVVYGEAATLGSSFTHAFMGGKATSGLGITVLRCVVKGVMPSQPSDLPVLRKTANVFIAAAAALVLLCAAILLFVMPRLDAVAQLLRDHPGLTLQQRLKLSQHAAGCSMPPGPTDSCCGCAQPCSCGSDAGSTASLGLSAEPASDHMQAACIVECAAPAGARHAAGCAKQAALPHWWQQPGSADGAEGNTRADRDLIKTWRLASASGESEHEAESCGRSSSCSGGAACAPQCQLPGTREAPVAAAGCAACACSTQQQGHLTQRPRVVVLCRACSSDLGEHVLVHVDALEPDSSHASGGSQQWCSCAVAAGAGAARKLQLPGSRRSLDGSAACGLQHEGMRRHTSTWLAVCLTYPYQLAAFLPALVTAAILPLILSPQVQQDSSLGSWSIQLTVLANQLGNTIGAGLLPIHQRMRHPRTTLLCAAVFMLSFIGAFVVMLKAQAGPDSIIPTTFAMYTYSGYLTSSVFCLASSGLQSADAELVQMLLVLTTSTSFVLGSGISWAWLAHGG